MAIENNLALKLIPVQRDLIVLNHNDYHIDIGEELVEIMVLVLQNVFLNEGIIIFEG